MNSDGDDSVNLLPCVGVLLEGTLQLEVVTVSDKDREHDQNTHLASLCIELPLPLVTCPASSPDMVMTHFTNNPHNK